tara:strand:- start:2537 stop:3190 length:654 start_codon:yes stop_codon:yes gene_type:complete
MNISKSVLKQIIKEELDSFNEKKDDPQNIKVEMDPGLKKTMDQLIKQLEELDLSVDFLSAVMADIDTVTLGAGQKGKGRYYKPIRRAETPSKKQALKLDEGDYGGDGQMADSQLNTIVTLATKLDMIVSDDTKLPNWVESKITKSLDYISTSLNYLIGEIEDAQEGMMREEKLTKPQIKDRDKRAKKIMKSTKKQYGKEEGEDIAYAIATNQVKEET